MECLSCAEDCLKLNNLALPFGLPWDQRERDVVAIASVNIAHAGLSSKYLCKCLRREINKKMCKCHSHRTAHVFMCLETMCLQPCPLAYPDSDIIIVHFHIFHIICVNYANV